MVKYTYNPPYNQWSGNRSDTLNKWKINYKGSIATASALPDEGEFKGDTYNVLEDGSNYMWNGSNWDKLDANIYIGATSIKNGIQGLVPPASNSQIYSLLTGGGTWESAEDLGLALDDEVVHLTGDEVIQGDKVFKNEKVYSTSGSHISNISIRNPAVERGTATSLVDNKKVFSNLYFLDNEGSEERPYNGRLAMLEYIVPSTSDLQESINLRCYDYFSENKADNINLSLGYDTDRIPYATAPETSDDRTDSADIVTRGYMEASKWNWQKTKKAGAVAFKPVPESDLEPVVDFMFTETPPASGEKGPDNPSTITGVTQAKVTRCGKNIISYPFYESSDPITKNDVTFTPNSDGSLTVNGTASGNTFYTVFLKAGSMQIGQTYTLSGCPSGGSVDTYLMCFGTRSDSCDFGNGFTRTLTGNDQYVVIRINSGYVASNLVFKPQLELSSTVTAFESYAGNDYTIQLGDTYYGGSLDVATGVMTVTWWGHVFDGTEGMVFGRTYDDVSMITTSLSGTTPRPATVVTTTDGSAFCTHYPHLFNWGDHVGFAVHGDGVIRFFTPLSIASTAADLQSFFATQYANGTPVVLTYPVKTPFTVQLTPIQIRSLPALDKYEPRVNTIYSDQKTVQVGYQQYFDENRLASIEARIEALEASQG